MKINIIPTIIAAAISALIAYALYAFCKTEGQELLLSIGGGVCVFLPLAATFGVRFKEGRTSVNTSVIGLVFFLLLLISHGIFAFVHFTTPSYIIINGILLLVFIGITYSIAKAKQ